MRQRSKNTLQNLKTSGLGLFLFQLSSFYTISRILNEKKEEVELCSSIECKVRNILSENTPGRLRNVYGNNKVTGAINFLSLQVKQM